MERKTKAKSSRLAAAVALLLVICCGSPTLSEAQIKISISLASPHAGVSIEKIFADSASISFRPMYPGDPDRNVELHPSDIQITGGSSPLLLTMLRKDSARERRSNAVLSVVLDNSSSMFAAFDSLTLILSSLLQSAPKDLRASGFTFDILPRTQQHIRTTHEDVFIAPSPLRTSTDSLATFFHSFDTIRSRFTPLYDAMAAAAQSVLQELDTAQSHILLVVTDGSDNASFVTIEHLNDLIRLAKMKLIVLNYRTSPDGPFQWLIRQRAGTIYYAESIAELRERLQDIFERSFRTYTAFFERSSAPQRRAYR